MNPSNPLAALFNNRDDDQPAPKRDPAIEAEVLRDLAAAFLAPQETFAIGDIVTWKPGLKNTAEGIDYGEPVVVLRVEPDRAEWLSDKQSGRGYYGHRPDLTVLFRDRDGAALTYGLDSRRVRRMTESEMRIIAVRPTA